MYHNDAGHCDIILVCARGHFHSDKYFNVLHCPIFSFPMLVLREEYYYYYYYTMALQNSDDHGGLNQSSQALLDKLDELLVGCTPKEVATEGHGLDYIAGLNELKRV